MSITLQKQEIRKLFKSKREALSGQEAMQKSQIINQNFITNLLPKLYQNNSSKNLNKVFSLYLSSNNEVFTSLIAEHFKKNKIQFSYPKIIKKNHHLEFTLYQENQIFAPNKFFPKILEPEFGDKISPDFIILPLVSFDSQLFRLGMGGGFFDRTIEFLNSSNKKVTTIGLAYDFQGSTSSLPIEKTDQRLDFIVTESSIFSAS